MRDADVVVEQINPLCGDEVTFYFKLSAKFAGPAVRHPRPTSSPALLSVGTKSKSKANPQKELNAGARRGSPTRVTPELFIKDVSFEGEGCAISIAAASILSGALKGKKAEKIEK